MTGASLEVTASAIGLGRDRVNVLRRSFREQGADAPRDVERRGGRRNAVMPIEEEARLLALCRDMAARGETDVAPLLQAVLRGLTGRPVALSTAYRLMARHLDP